MKLLVTHSSPDFDALSSLALAKLVHPGAVAVLQGTIPASMERVLELYKDTLEFTAAEDIKLTDVTELIVVDTSDKDRIAPFNELLGKVPVTLYDHHPRTQDAIPAVRGLHREVGATASILTLLLSSQNIAIPAELASLALLGIHDDTGSLSYPSTRSEDYDAAAHLLRSGASLEFLQTFLREHYETSHRELFAKMLESSRTHDVLGHSVVLAKFRHDKYIPGLAPLCNELLEFYTSEAAFILAEMAEKTFVIARSRTTFDVAKTLEEAFNGGGHPSAGFARTDLSLDEAEAKLLDVLPHHTTPELTAKDVMSRPVKTIQDTASLSEAQQLLIYFGHNGLPVIDAKGRLVGILSRRDLDKARHHVLAEREVRSLMTQPVISATETTPTRDLETLMQQHGIGRIPILRGNELVGIVTRSDVLRARHPVQIHTTLADELFQRLPQGALSAITKAQEVLEHGTLYLVGGTVRDLYLGISIQDYDLLLEGANTSQFAKKLQAALGGRLTCHDDFGTCTLELENGLTLDIATARDEYYDHPGALPTITQSTLQKDLARRDFSINTLALKLAPKPATLLDPFNALTDLHAKKLRILHPLSFIEDPTRMLRGARLAGRLGFSWEEATHERIAPALATQVLSHVSPSRFRTELELTLKELRVTPALKHLQNCGALGAIFGMTLNPSWTQHLDTLRQTLVFNGESYLLTLLMSIAEDDLTKKLETFGWPTRYLDSLKRLREIEKTGGVSSPQFTKLNEAEKLAARALSDELDKRIQDLTLQFMERRLTGQDVLDLGLKSGPDVGRVLAHVATARDAGQVCTFEDELELARQLVRVIIQETQ